MKGRAEIMLGLAAMMAAIDSTSQPERGRRFIETPNSDTTAAKDNYMSVLKRRDGVKEYFINGKTVLARSYKNALKKASKI